MSDSTKTDDRKEKARSGKPNQHPIKVIRIGAIAASVWKRQTATGFEYLDFSLSRSWKLKSGEREGYSQSFFENNEEALFDVINLACSYIRDQQSDESQSPTNANLVVGEPLAA